MLLPFLLAACGGGDASDAIDRTAFVDTYTDLRIAAIQTDSQRVSAADRDSILALHGVSEVDLQHFVEVHASDVEFMRDVWNDVEVILDQRPEVEHD